MVVTMTEDITPVVRAVLRANAFANAGTLPPTRLNTIAMQLAQFLHAEYIESATALGETLCHQGLGLHSLLMVWQAAQAHHLRYNEPSRVHEISRKMSNLIEAFVDCHTSKIRAEQERLRSVEKSVRLLF